jgi:ubiquitin C-terminal hydrolase
MQGLQNLGSTCAINSLIQIICRNADLRNTILKLDISDDTLTYHLKEILDMMHNQHHSLAPKKFLTHFYKTFEGIFRVGEQLDIGELWMFLFDKIATECGNTVCHNACHSNYVNDLKYLQELTNENISKCHELEHKCMVTIQKINSNKTSEWLQTSQGIMLSMLQCHECHQTLYNFEPFTSIPLDITEEDKPTIASMFRNYLKPQTCNGEWKCEKCNKYTTYSKSLKIWKLPSVLMFLVKRFINVHQKNTKAIKINSKLCVKKGSVINNMASDHVYKCSSLALHYGSLMGGHYRALCQTNDKFILYDDLNMTVIPDENMSKTLENNSDAYMIVYVLSRNEIEQIVID